MLPLSHTGLGIGPVERRRPLSRAGAFPGVGGLLTILRVSGGAGGSRGKTRLRPGTQPCPALGTGSVLDAHREGEGGESQQGEEVGRVRGVGPRTAELASLLCLLLAL